MTTYRTGQRFKCLRHGKPLEATLREYSPKQWYLDAGVKGNWYIGDGSGESLSEAGITDLELLPDTDEPVKGDLVEVSDDNTDWTAKPRIYTGYQEEDGHYLTDLGGSYASWKHIRKAPSPEQARREEIEKWLFDNPKVNINTDLIYNYLKDHNLL